MGWIRPKGCYPDRMSARLIRRLTAALLTLSLTASPGCAGGAADAGPTPAEREAALASAVSAMSPMPNETRSTSLPPSFPREVPVIDGTVVSAEAQGPRVWTYELVADSAAEVVERWYSRAYLGRAWTTWRQGEVAVAETPGPGEGNVARSVIFRKGERAESEFVFLKEPGGKTRVRAAVGIGVPVSETR